MANWTPDELDRIGGADELQISSTRTDGSLRPFITIWVVRSGDALFVRSAYGPNNGWYRRAAASGTGRIRAGGLDRDVYFIAADDPDETIDAAYHAKYDRYGARIVNSVVGSAVAALTLELVPR